MRVPSRLPQGLAALALALAFAAAPASATTPNLPSTNVAWLPAASDADIERAFAQARAQNKPLLLYWGATWCPPCNNLKATLFNRQDFAAQSRAFVAVHVDGDRPGAQRVGRRFQVAGYPTVLLLRPDGTEITRLPGEVDAAQVMAVLHLGLADGRPVKAVLADALAGRSLSGNDWRLLAFYSWETDHESLVPRAQLPDTLARLALAAPAADAESGTRLWLKAVAASTEGQGIKPDAAMRERLQRLLADPLQARTHMDMLTGSSAATLVRALAPEGGSADAARTALLAAFEPALRRLQADPALSRADRLSALHARVELARVDQSRTQVQVALPAALVTEVRQHVTRDDAEIRDGYERQAVITHAAHVLGRAGLWAESEGLLKTNLAKSHSPYYLMSQLGGNARRQGKNDEALNWYAQSYTQATGPATRLQWGSNYLQALVDLAPQDTRRIEQTYAALLADAGKDSAAFEGRSLRSLQRAAEKLRTWGSEAPRAPVLRRLQAQTDTLCRRVDTADGQRAACQALFRPAGAAGRDA